MSCYSLIKLNGISTVDDLNSTSDDFLIGIGVKRGHLMKIRSIRDEGIPVGDVGLVVEMGVGIGEGESSPIADSTIIKVSSLASDEVQSCGNDGLVNHFHTEPGLDIEHMSSTVSNFSKEEGKEQCPLDVFISELEGNQKLSPVHCKPVPKAISASLLSNGSFRYSDENKNDESSHSTLEDNFGANSPGNLSTKDLGMHSDTNGLCDSKELLNPIIAKSGNDNSLSHAQSAISSDSRIPDLASGFLL
jgi:hypothetical protein